MSWTDRSNRLIRRVSLRAARISFVLNVAAFWIFKDVASQEGVRLKYTDLKVYPRILHVKTDQVKMTGLQQVKTSSNEHSFMSIHEI